MELNCKHIVCFAICGVLSSGIATTCEGPTLVEKGSPANITCNFDSHIIEKRRPFGIDKYTGGLPHVIVRCQWPNVTSVGPTCIPKAGDLDIDFPSPSERLTMTIPSVTEKDAGTYGCLEMASNNPVESCKLTVKTTVNGKNITTCAAPSVQVGEEGRLTCYFGFDITVTSPRPSIKVQRYSLDDVDFKRATDVLNCYWYGHALDCTSTDNGIDFIYNLKDQLTIVIPNATLDDSGRYKCQLVPSHQDVPDACVLTVNGYRESTKPDSGGRTNFDFIIVPSVVGGLSLVCIIITIVVFVRRKCRNSRNRCTDGVSISEELQTSSNEERKSLVANEQLSNPDSDTAPDSISVENGENRMNLLQ